MMDMLLTTNQLSPPPVLTTQLFNVVGSNLFPSYTINLGASVTYEAAPSIDGVTLGGSLGSLNNTNIAFDTTVDLTLSNWTLEYSVVVTGADSAQYIGEISLTSALNTPGFYTRYSQTAFDNRFGVVTSDQLTGVYSPNILRSGMGTLHRIALVKVGSVINLYFDGIKRPLAVGQTANYTTTDIPATNLLKTVKYLVIGRNSAMGACTLKVGPIRFSGYARYTSDYTPVPF